MKPERIDITGKTFGRLKVVRFAGHDNRGRAVWLCLCKCGAERECVGTDLRGGRAKACHKCAKEMMGRMFRKRALERPPMRLCNPAEIVPMLNPAQRQRYDRWEAACQTLGVEVMPAERLQILREILT